MATTSQERKLLRLLPHCIERRLTVTQVPDTGGEQHGDSSEPRCLFTLFEFIPSALRFLELGRAGG